MTVRRYCLLLLVSVMLLSLRVAVCGAATTAGTWGPWPKGDAPGTVGVKLVRNLLARKHFAMAHGFSYMESCAGYAAARFTGSLGHKRLLAAVVKRYAVILTRRGRKYIPPPVNVDNSVFGLLPLEIYQQTGLKPYLKLGMRFANAQWNKPIAGNLSPETNYYLDGAFKLAAVQIHAWQITHKQRYARRAIRELLLFIRDFQQPDGLFFHGIKAHVYWGRGDGWMASALTEAVTGLPATMPGYGKIMKSYKAMMAGLLTYQAKDGMWRQVVNDPKAWNESSCTGMFTYALATGVNHGWLHGNKYRTAVKKGWLALCRHLDSKYNVRDVCILTEHANNWGYYLSRPKQTGNLHGQFSMMWAARELCR